MLYIDMSSDEDAVFEAACDRLAATIREIVNNYAIKDYRLRILFISWSIRLLRMWPFVPWCCIPLLKQ